MRKLARPTAIAAACLALAAPASAQQLEDWSQGWTGQATLYAWLPVINGSQEGPDGEPLVDLSTSDVLSALNMAFMGSAIFQKDKFGILLDAVYADLGTDGKWIQNRVDTRTTTKLGMYTAAAMYRVYDDPKGFVDVYGGVRYFDTSIDFRLSTANLGDADLKKSLTWTDGIVGVRGGVALNDKWALAGFADVGGFDGSSDLSWEMYGGANYLFNERWQGTIGYRYVSIEKQVTDRAALDIDLQGPLFGITYKF